MRIRLITALFVFQLTALFSIAQDQAKPTVMLWPNGLPADAKPVDDTIIEKQRKRERERKDIIGYVETPTLTVYQPEKANGCAMVICPGGGYNILAWPKEGLELAEYLNKLGVTAFVLKYRVPRRDVVQFHWEPMQDVQRSIRLVRSQAEQWKIDPDRIGVMGFSAGGHLTVMAGTQYKTKCYERVDDADDLSCRPNFICPIYAAYLGDDYKDDKAKLGSQIVITKDTPPTFMAVTGDDWMRGALAALMYVKLRELNVPAELHVYTKGGHGYGIRPSNNPVSTWHHRMTEWMKSMEFFESAK